MIVPDPTLDHCNSLISDCNEINDGKCIVLDPNCAVTPALFTQGSVSVSTGVHQRYNLNCLIKQENKVKTFRRTEIHMKIAIYFRLFLFCLMEPNQIEVKTPSGEMVLWENLDLCEFWLSQESRYFCRSVSLLRFWISSKD